ncbi:chromate transporter [Fusobacterium ulcerans]|jgi:chromate transporter|uniref:chromate transporter n=1 Tax=Fusobacterium ulcerans TaxID=861 RepID=UPI000E525195|nr:chromate transporter [Fusobacterium ulcerans]RGY59489.1 chromate transporter [Fusobacterium ulcerans]
MKITITENIRGSLFLSFAKIGLFTFGGGYAMISLIEAECVKKKKWITHDEMLNVTVIAESTPGPIALNCATYIGYKQGGLLGAIIATLGIVLPSFVIIYLISLFFTDFLSITVITNAFKGIKIAVGLLILNAAIIMIKKMQKKALSHIIMLISFTIMLCVNIFSWPISSIYIILIAGIISLLISLILDVKLIAKGGQKNDIS